MPFSLTSFGSCEECIQLSFASFNALIALLYVTIKTMNRIKVCTLSIDVHYCIIDQDNLRTIYLVNIILFTCQQHIYSTSLNLIIKAN